MRLYELELHEYIGIYNGLGLDKITIPFYKCQNNIVVIKGDNGSGKSTIYKALHPFSDNNEALVPGKTAYKKISYITNDNKLLEISYVYPYDSYKDTRKTTKCSVKLNKKELNSNGNMTSGKDIIESLLGIDSSLMNLAQLSSDDRGLADKKPAKRKEFLNKNIRDIDAFNVIYKKIAKGTSMCKALVDSMDAKLKSVGDVEKLKSNLKLYTNQYARLDEESTSLLIQASKIQATMENMVQNNLNPEEMMDSINNQLFSLKETMRNSLYDAESISEEQINEANTKLNNIESNYQSTKDKLSYIQSIKQKTKSRLESIEIKLNSMKDVNLLSQYKEKYKDLKNKEKDLLNRIHVIGFDERQIEYINSNIEDVFYINSILHETIESFKERYSLEDLSNAIAYLEDRIINHKDPDYCNPEHVDEIQINSMRAILERQNFLIRQQEFYKKNSIGIEKIPSDCVHKNDCPFVMNITKAHDSILSKKDYDDLLTLKNNTEEDIKNAEKTNEIRKNALNCASDISSRFYKNYKLFTEYSYNVVSFICRDIKIPSTDEERFYMIKQYLLGNNSSWYAIDMNAVNDLKNLCIQYTSIHKDTETYKNTINVLSSNQEVYNTLKSEYDSLMDDLKSINADEIENTKNLNSYDKEYKTINTLISYQKRNLDMKNRYDAAKKEYEDYLEKKKKYEDDSKKYAELNKQLIDITTKNKSLLDNQMTSLRKEIDSITYSLNMYNEYVKDYKEYKDRYIRFAKLKKYTSPTTGIQTVYAEMFMNGILSEANDLLSLFFGGEFQLQPFVIDEKDFRMPVLGSGIMNDDVSSMSNAQICMTSMILSFVLMSKASDEYNIIKLDEIDGALDTNNRSIFFNALYALMAKLQFEQCILISHNSELNTQNMDMIILKNTDSNMKLDGNVIYDYNV